MGPTDHFDRLPEPIKQTITALTGNTTGLPDNLKSGIETLSGYKLEDVRVHYNSMKPVQLGAASYACGMDIHLAPGQEKHLPHEAWHVVQQKQGRVGVNDDGALEREADAMGAKAVIAGTPSR